ncbi:MAG: GNAT family N-acetyltransferase [Chloroflexi bacterium]|nr:GNAT family N-acetyltransferase [Chloroflexota bacterium]
MSADPYAVRLAVPADALVLARHRRWMFESMGLEFDLPGDAFEVVTARAIADALGRGAFVAWVIDYRGQIVAGGGIQLREQLPRPGLVEAAPEAYILNVWTNLDHRRRGLASRLLDTMIDWCRERGVRRLALHASEQGRHVYERYGFRPTNEMRVILDA